ncbi:GNAT family N-acetyltransferase [Flagellimonas allohymeniacidonis]|uniref:GNAT family N-acetyltransferase n=1 Tax=Flagellimonas allohymeniacidonis TaxID=2517819 RepID=A0A4Q8QHQ3_9FLAO|nr:GNAT family N-acetyltransferase [Allomuricauda hymeniacidonis]TAI48818.1 GNAT family N-acetyltransferase [Allomuricauda hymeniacidonis]
MEEIRLANKEDASSIALLGRITFTETFGNLFTDREGLKNYLDTTFSVDKIEQSLQKENNAYWIALVDRLPVGYAKLKLHSPSDFVPSEKAGQLQKIYVLKDFLSMKIGKRLQDVLLKKAKASGCELIWLSVYKGNQRAIRFYEKNNFKTVGEHQFNIGKDTFEFMAMAKRLVNH